MTGVLQQLTGDTRILVKAIEGIRYLGGGTSAASAGRPAGWHCTTRWRACAIFPGRKVVVLFAENPGVPGPWDRTQGEAAHAAHAAGAAVYAVRAASAADVPCTREARREHWHRWRAIPAGCSAGFRARSYKRARLLCDWLSAGRDTSIDPAGRWSPATGPARLKVRRPGVVLRARTGFLSHAAASRFSAAGGARRAVEEALASPFARSRYSRPADRRFLGLERPGSPIVDAILYFDAPEISVIHDLQDMYHGSLQLRTAAYADDGRSTVPLMSASKIAMRPAEYRYGIEHGLRLSFQITLPSPGGWQIRAVVADGTSDRIGPPPSLSRSPTSSWAAWPCRDWYCAVIPGGRQSAG